MFWFWIGDVKCQILTFYFVLITLVRNRSKLFEKIKKKRKKIKFEDMVKLWVIRDEKGLQKSWCGWDKKDEETLTWEVLLRILHFTACTLLLCYWVLWPTLLLYNSFCFKLVSGSIFTICFDTNICIFMVHFSLFFWYYWYSLYKSYSYTLF